MVMSPARNVYVAARSQVVEFTQAGIPLRSWSGQAISSHGPLFDAAGFTVDRQGNLYVSDLDNNALEIFSPSGRKLASWTRLGPKGPALSALGPVTVDAPGR
jgi:sugar lactone lactonase YvrE